MICSYVMKVVRLGTRTVPTPVKVRKYLPSFYFCDSNNAEVWKYN